MGGLGRDEMKYEIVVRAYHPTACGYSFGARGLFIHQATERATELRQMFARLGQPVDVFIQTA